MLIFHIKYDREHFLCQKLPVKSFLHHREWKVHMNRLTWIKTGETSCRHWLADWASLIFITQSSETITESLRWICHRDYFTSCQYQQPQVASDCLLRVKTWIHYRWKHLHVYWREQSTQVSEENIWSRMKTLNSMIVILKSFLVLSVKCESRTEKLLEP